MLSFLICKIQLLCCTSNILSCGKTGNRGWSRGNDRSFIYERLKGYSLLERQGSPGDWCWEKQASFFSLGRPYIQVELGVGMLMQIILGYPKRIQPFSVWKDLRIFKRLLKLRVLQLCGNTWLQGHYAQPFPNSHLTEEGKIEKALDLAYLDCLYTPLWSKSPDTHGNSQLPSAFKQSMILLVAAVDPVVAEIFVYWISSFQSTVQGATVWK